MAIGSIDVLSILLPDKMMQLLEYTTDFQPNDYKLRFVTQAAGVHSLCHLAQFFALWQGKDPITSVGYSAITTAVLGLLVCVIGLDAPLAPIFPLIGMYAFMSWKLLWSQTGSRLVTQGRICWIYYPLMQYNSLYVLVEWYCWRVLCVLIIWDMDNNEFNRISLLPRLLLLTYFPSGKYPLGCLTSQSIVATTPI